MEGTYIRTSPRASFLKSTANFSFITTVPATSFMKTRGGRAAVSLRCVRDQQARPSDEASEIEDAEIALKVKGWEVEKFQSEIASRDGIRIRRRPPSGPPLHYVGPFEFRLQNEGNTPINILEEIIWNKHTEVAQLKEKRPLHTLKKGIDNTPVRDFVKALKDSYLRNGLPALIAEVKKASPSRGVIREDFDPVKIAKAYERAGAACLSVLTDRKYFQGSFENLEAIRKAGIKRPLLCKEFVIDAWQIYYARTKGADAILLIAAVLPDLDIRYMIKICKMLGLAALVEVHDEREMDRVLAIEGIELIGINNRNLGFLCKSIPMLDCLPTTVQNVQKNDHQVIKTLPNGDRLSDQNKTKKKETFEVDISNTKKLLEGERGKIIHEKDIIVVGESGLFTPDDIAYVQDAGVKAVLVGESIVKQDDPEKGIRGLFGKDISS